MPRNKTIELTDEQYKSLVRLIFYGDWVLHANSIGEENRDREAEDLREYIFGYKEKFNLKHWFRNLKFGEELEEPIIMQLLKKVFRYNEKTFLFLLAQKLAERDAFLYHLKNGGDPTDNDAITNLSFEIADAYLAKLENEGVEDLFFKESNPDDDTEFSASDN